MKTPTSCNFFAVVAVLAAVTVATVLLADEKSEVTVPFDAEAVAKILENSVKDDFEKGVTHLNKGHDFLDFSVEEEKEKDTVTEPSVNTAIPVSNDRKQSIPDEKRPQVIVAPPPVNLPNAVARQLAPATRQQVEEVIHVFEAKAKRANNEAMRIAYRRTALELANLHEQKRIQEQASLPGDDPGDIDHHIVFDSPTYDATEADYTGIPVRSLESERRFFDAALLRPDSNPQPKEDTTLGGSGTAASTNTDTTINDAGATTDRPRIMPTSMRDHTLWHSGNSDPATAILPRHQLAISLRHDDKKLFAAPPTPASQPVTENIGGVRISYDLPELERNSVSSAALNDLARSLLASRSGNDAAQIASAFRTQSASSPLQKLEAASLEDLVLVSLSQIHRGASSHLDDWAQCPDSIRFLGNIGRIVGFVANPENDDVVLIGKREGSGSPIDLNDLITGLRSVWQEGLTPTCSLSFPGTGMADIIETKDVDSIVTGVPFETHFAQVMLDADYVLKQHIFTSGFPEIHGFQTAPERINELYDSTADFQRGYMYHRYWFTPAENRRGEIMISEDERMAIFTSGLRVQTETMTVDGRSAGFGVKDEVGGPIAESISANMDLIEDATPDISDLHGLFDIVRFASLAKLLLAENSILKKIVDLPVLPVTVQRTYPAITEPVLDSLIKGGVDLEWHPRPSDFLHVNSPSWTDLRERAYFDGTYEDLHDLPVFIVQPAGESGPDQRSAEAWFQTEIRRAYFALDRGRPKEAHRIASALQQLRPEDQNSYELHARAFIQEELYWLADRELEQAQRYSGDALLFRLWRRILHADRQGLAYDETIDEVDRASASAIFKNIGLAFEDMGYQNLSLEHFYASLRLATPEQERLRYLLWVHVAELESERDGGGEARNKALEEARRIDPEGFELLAADVHRLASLVNIQRMGVGAFTTNVLTGPLDEYRDLLDAIIANHPDKAAPFFLQRAQFRFIAANQDIPTNPGRLIDGQFTGVLLTPFNGNPLTEEGMIDLITHLHQVIQVPLEVWTGEQEDFFQLASDVLLGLEEMGKQNVVADLRKGALILLDHQTSTNPHPRIAEQAAAALERVREAIATESP